MKKVSLERYYFVLYDGALSLKVSNMALITHFAIQLFICDHASQNHQKLLYMDF